MLFPWIVAISCLTDAGERPAPVAPVDWSRLCSADFTDHEFDLPFALAHFHRLANSVRSEAPDRGFIDLQVWRYAKDNRPYNARVMENHLSLAFFYCTPRPWNPYFGQPAVRQRLESALDFWCGMQNADGRFSEYGPQQWNLPATAFATKFMGRTLTLLAAGPPIDPQLHRRVREANRKAIEAVLNDPEMYRSGKSFSNQYTNVWPGVLAHLALFPDDRLQTLFQQRLQESGQDLQSPAGYFYEADGPDWSYNLNTHHSNLNMAWHYARGTPAADAFVAEMQAFYDWLSYNAVLEPDGAGYILNRAVETRRQVAFLPPYQASLHSTGVSQAVCGTPLAEHVDSARPFVPSREELRQQRDLLRAQLETDWPELPPLTDGFSTYSPYQFLHRDQYEWHPTAAQKAEAQTRLPYLARTAFIHQRTDGRHLVVYTFVRQPGYYAAFNSGKQITSQQRYGLGLLWTPQTGGLLQSQTGSNEAAWGTQAEGAKRVYEAGSIAARFTVDGQPVESEPGCRDLPGRLLSAVYSLSDAGEKEITFAPVGVTVAIRHPGRFVEHLPLLIGPDDRVDVEPEQTRIQRNGTAVHIDYDKSAAPEMRKTALTVGPYSVAVLRLRANDQLGYSIRTP